MTSPGPSLEELRRRVKERATPDVCKVKQRHHIKMSRKWQLRIEKLLKRIGPKWSQIGE
jgi:hypothetical protein